MRSRPPDWVRAAAGITVVAWGANQFAALLPVYREAAGLSASFVSLAFATYVVGLIPALFLAAGFADRFDRRWPVRVAVVLGAAASAVLCLGFLASGWLLVGRLLAGVAVGAVLGPGTAWVTALSSDDRAGAPRRVAVALSLGFGGGPLLAGLVAQWAPLPQISPYLIHIALSVVVAALLWNAPDPSVSTAQSGPAVRTAGAADVTPREESLGATLASPAFWRLIPLTAPWVFGVVTMSFAVVPSVVHIPGLDVATAGIITGTTLGTGALIQPLAQRLERRRPGFAMPLGLALASAGMLLCLAAFVTLDPLLMAPIAVVLGSAYGLILVAGLRHMEQLGNPRDRARLSAVFYSLTYVGFTQPLLFTTLATTPGLQRGYALVGAVVAAATAAWVLVGRRPLRSS